MYRDCSVVFCRTALAKKGRIDSHALPNLAACLIRSLPFRPGRSNHCRPSWVSRFSDPAGMESVFSFPPWRATFLLIWRYGGRGYPLPYRVRNDSHEVPPPRKSSVLYCRIRSLKSLTFAAQTVGTTSAAQTVTMTNTGTATLRSIVITASSPISRTTTCR